MHKTHWRSRTSCRKFGDLITTDHKVLSEGCECRNNHRYAVVVQDLATLWIQSYPCKTKTSQETERSLQKFLEPNRKPNVIYTDNSLDIGKACEDLSWNHCTSTPHRSETNGIAERAVRRVKEGTSAVLLQSGLDENWSADSLECFSYLRNIQDLLSDAKTPHERRFGKPLNGPIIPFGSLVAYYPISPKDQSRIHQFGKKVLPGLFLGYALHARGIWKGDVLIADLEELETMDASEIYSKRLNAKEVILPKENGILFFQSDHPIRGESRRDFLGESEGSLPPPQDSLPDASESINDFPWRQLSFVDDEEVISLSHAKVYVFSDSVLCLGKMNENPQSNIAWEDSLRLFKSSSQCRALDTIDGEPMEFEWTISQDSPHCSSATKSMS